MTTATLNFGVLGRCGCGALGRRRSAFADEPICSKCVPYRSGYLHVTTLRDAVLMQERTVGALTPAQRKARVAWLQGSYVRESTLGATSAEIHASVSVQDAKRTARGRGIE